ncbi:MAG: hypothetical protein H0W02_10665 [Ktedonobacteraceae bacterium]|nr:hypothetical protein [Ktedonobacteraceae bacterium]
MEQKAKEEQDKKPKKQEPKKFRRLTVEEAIQLSMRQFAKEIEYLKDK